MPRSLRAWLASLALIAFPGVSSPYAATAQTFMGPPHMAPVALEARSMLSDGTNGRIGDLAALGADPLQSSILLADTTANPAAANPAAANPAAANPTAAGAIAAAPELLVAAVPAEARSQKAAPEQAAKEGSTRSAAATGESRADEGVPACYVESPPAPGPEAIEESLTALAHEEPLDVASSSAASENPVPVGCGGLCLATDAAVPAAKAREAKLDSQESASPGPGAEQREAASCDWDAYEWDASEWDECSELAKWSELAECGMLAGCSEPAGCSESAACGKLAGSERAGRVAAGGVAAAEGGDEVKGSNAVECRAGTADSAEGTRFVGSSPVIVTLEEEYLPYDLCADEPLRLRLLPFSVRRSCPLEDRPMVAAKEAAASTEDVASIEDVAAIDDVAAAENLAAIEEATAGQVADQTTSGAAASDPEAVIPSLLDLVPSSTDWAALSRWADTLQPPMPVHCWMEEVIWQLNDALDPRGPVRSRLQAEQIGNQMAQWGIQLEQNVAAAAEPVMPILVRVIAPQQQPVAPPAGIPQRPVAAEKVELAVAANALISAAGQLESVAAALRSWGTSLDRVAKAAPVEAATLQR